MARKELPKWTKLVEKAVRDAKFRDELVKDPKGVAAAARVTLDRKDAAGLRKVSSHLKRFGGQKSIATRDAKSWTVGIMSHLQFCVCERPDEE
jgi:hypothetical protein